MTSPKNFLNLLLKPRKLSMKVNVREIRLQLAKSLHLRKLGIQLKVRVCELGQHLGKFFCRGLFILILNERELEREY